MEWILSMLSTAFTAAGFEYAFNAFPTDANHPDFPYVSAMITGFQPYFADDENYHVEAAVELDLFLKFFNPALIDSFINVLNDLELVWEAPQVVYSTSDKVYQVIFRFNINQED